MSQYLTVLTMNVIFISKEKRDSLKISNFVSSTTLSAKENSVVGSAQSLRLMSKAKLYIFRQSPPSRVNPTNFKYLRIAECIFSIFS